ncbi:unnamed protein product, partial [Meganyctiphanes norvegica]
MDELTELLYHWPHEEFNLKKVMPTIRPRLNKFAYYWSPYHLSPYHKNSEVLFNFHGRVVKSISRYFMNDYEERFPELHKHTCKIRKINTSSYYSFIYRNIKDQMTEYEPFLKNSIGKLEVNLDTIFAGNIKDIEHATISSYSNSSSSVRFKFKHAAINLIDSYEAEELTPLLEKLANNGTVSISIGGSSGFNIGSEVMENAFKIRSHTTSASQVNILETQLAGSATSLNFLQYLNNLVHLDLTNNNLHGTLDNLMYIRKGLLYLRMHNCKLDNADLEHLVGSRHQLTLRSLNLGSNSFKYDKTSPNLIKLCDNLPKTLHLELDTCGLDSWLGNEIQLLFDSFQRMPNIVYINLINHQFTLKTVTERLMVLRENSKLRYLEVTLTTSFNEIHENHRNRMIKGFCAKINAHMNKMRSNLLYV